MFNKYYQDELTYLRELGREFASAYPAIAPLLAERGGDPDVERLLEGVAFLTGKIRQKLDDELPEVIHSVASLLFPHYLRQVPATSVIEFTPLPNVVREKLLVAKNAEIGSVPVDGVSCRFRTTQDVELVPMAVEDVRVDTGAQLAQSLRIELKVTGGASLAALNLTRLRHHGRLPPGQGDPDGRLRRGGGPHPLPEHGVPGLPLPPGVLHAPAEVRLLRRHGPRQDAARDGERQVRDHHPVPGRPAPWHPPDPGELPPLLLPRRQPVRA